MCTGERKRRVTIVIELRSRGEGVATVARVAPPTIGA
jgi:hypothetical protein